ncbi:hypothetical protein ACH4GK_25815 [Streptomyces rimosus]|uniref:hypothetical protein n=1 Tax=Streptomyces rimosus TaxID=1927 RepID=UPI0004C976CB|nr:hypothetical protein [Streptomyces rimosus]
MGDNVREYLALFYPQVAFGGTAFGGTSDRSPCIEREIDEYARTYTRPTALSGGFELIAPWARTCGPGPEGAGPGLSRIGQAGLSQGMAQ